MFNQHNILKIGDMAESWFKDNNADILKQIAGLKQSISRLENNRKNLLDLLIDGTLSKEDLKAKVEEINSKNPTF